MRKLIIIMLVSLLAISAKTQVYDGITQGTRFRVIVPASTNTETKNVSSAPFIGYKQDITKWLNVTGVAQYNISTESFTPQLWLNFSANDKIYFLARSIYDSKTKEFRETLSATYKIYKGLHLDSTWENMLVEGDLLERDRLQFLAGYDFNRFVLNAGYSCRQYSGFVTNLRVRIDKLNWLQLKYDSGVDVVTLSAGLNFN